MKIIYVINAFNRGGAEIGLLTLLESDMFKGIDLEIVSICAGSGEILSDVTKLGVPVVFLSSKKDMKLWMIPASIVKLVTIFSRQRPDAVILSLPQANICGRIAAKISGVKHVISFEHNTHLAKSIYEKLFRATSSAVTMMLADSATTGKLAEQRLYRRPPPQSLVVPLVSFLPSSPRGPAPPQPRIVSVGRLTSTKNHQAVIRAIALLRSTGVDVQLEILGDGPLRGELETLKSALGVDDLVGLPGFVESWNTRAAYSAFVLSSHHEGLCIVALEAMQSGIPVITPIVGGMADYVTDDNATVLQNNTPEAIAEAITRVLSDKHATSRKSDQARQMVQDRFGYEATRSRFASINETLLNLR